MTEDVSLSNHSSSNKMGAGNEIPFVSNAQLWRFVVILTSDASAMASTSTWDWESCDGVPFNDVVSIHSSAFSAWTRTSTRCSDCFFVLRCVCFDNKSRKYCRGVMDFTKVMVGLPSKSWGCAVAYDDADDTVLPIPFVSDSTFSYCTHRVLPALSLDITKRCRPPSILSTLIRPDSEGVSKPCTRRNRVDLPEDEGPVKRPNPSKVKVTFVKAFGRRGTEEVNLRHNVSGYEWVTSFKFTWKGTMSTTATASSDVATLVGEGLVGVAAKPVAKSTKNPKQETQTQTWQQREYLLLSICSSIWQSEYCLYNSCHERGVFVTFIYPQLCCNQTWLAVNHTPCPSVYRLSEEQQMPCEPSLSLTHSYPFVRLPLSLCLSSLRWCEKSLGARFSTPSSATSQVKSS